MKKGDLNKGRKSLLALILTTAFLMGLFTGCAGAGSKTPGNYQVALEKPPAATDKLVIYQPPDMKLVLSLAIPIYKATFPDVEVEIRDFFRRMRIIVRL